MNINLRVLSVAVMVAIVMLGLVQIADPASLGISPVVQRWLGIILAGLGALQGVLPRVQGPTTDPKAVADRVWNLPPDDREMVAADLSARSERERRRLLSPEPIFDAGLGREQRP